VGVNNSYLRNSAIFARVTLFPTVSTGYSFPVVRTIEIFVSSSFYNVIWSHYNEISRMFNCVGTLLSYLAILKVYARRDKLLLNV
jgi:hypothetical protein